MIDEWKDAELDKDIERLLAVEPPPGFTLRVRQRIVNEKAHSNIMGWRAASALLFVSAAVVVMSAIVQHPVQSRPSPVPAGTATGASVPEPAAVVLVPQQNRPVDHSTKKVHRETEFFAGETEARAFAELRRSVDSGRIDLTKLLEQRDAALQMQPLPELRVEPLSVAPIIVEPLPQDPQEEMNR